MCLFATVVLCVNYACMYGGLGAAKLMLRLTARPCRCIRARRIGAWSGELGEQRGSLTCRRPSSSSDCDQDRGGMCTRAGHRKSATPYGDLALPLQASRVSLTDGLMETRYFRCWHRFYRPVYYRERHTSFGNGQETGQPHPWQASACLGADARSKRRGGPGAGPDIGRGRCGRWCIPSMTSFSS